MASSFQQRLALAAYSALWRLALPAVFARFWWRGRHEPPYRQGWAQRLGAAPVGAAPSASPTSVGVASAPLIWLHAVSLGETRAALPLIEALRQTVPGLRLLLTTATATGWQAGQAALREGDIHTWVPVDTPGACRRFLRRFKPDLGVLMETETWPNLLSAARRQGVPMVLANARLSQRSLHKGLRWRALTGPMMAGLDAVLAQTQADADRFQAAGTRADRIQVCGNLKFDAVPAPELLARGLRWREAAQATGRRIVLAASWREGEDGPLLQAWQSPVAPSTGRPLLLWVPRHPQRFDEVAAQVRQAGLTVARRSAWGDAIPAGPSADDLRADVWLGDSMGEMPAYYACADVALLGGSFAPLGGQNLIEAAACGCPVIMGPNTFNFMEAAEWAQRSGAARRAVDLQQAWAMALDLTAPQLQGMREAASGYAAQHRGATQRMAHLLQGLLRSRSA